MLIDQIGGAFGVRLLAIALVVISGFYRLQRQEIRVDFLSIIARVSK
jgi:hypothetical protein